MLIMSVRSFRFVVPVALAITLAISPASIAAQDRPASPAPDLGGLWEPSRAADIVEFMKAQGQEVPFTPHGADRYRNVDYAKNPNGFCLPPGPSRALTGGSMFFMVQDRQAVGLFIENHGVFRIIYLDGRGHPEDIAEYPTFMGHSVGKWEGDTLVVDTIGLNDRTWLDSNGLEHSEKLRLTERFQKVSPDLIKYSVTYDDPVFFTRPWTMTIDIKKVTDSRLIEYVCLDNEKDSERLVPTPR
jgi:hypothetical protein